MYRVMVIDDEKSMRCLLKKVIKWDEFDMEVVGDAESGIEAINKIDELEPHKRHSNIYEYNMGF